MKKPISLLLALLLVFALMGGCAQDPDTAEIPPVSEPSDPEAAGPEPTVSNPTGPEPTVPGPNLSEPPASTPLLWLVTAPGGQTMYLFGSIHVADAALYPLPDAVMDAFFRCDYLAVEVDMIAFSQDMRAVIALNTAMTYTDGSTIADEIGEELYEKVTDVMAGLGAELRSMGLTIELLNMLRPFFWYQLLTAITTERAGLSGEYGLDMFFLTEAYERGMEILEIESMEMQLEIFLNFSQPLTNALLESYLEIDEAVAALEELYGLWKLGDRNALEAHFDADTDDLSPELTAEFIDALMTQRDIGMVAAAEQFMAEGKKVFYVVGLFHMVGDNGIIEQLIAKGYAVERIPV
jgi:hypothetical protein